MSSVKHVILQGEKITRIFHQGKTETKVLDGVESAVRSDLCAGGGRNNHG